MSKSWLATVAVLVWQLQQPHPARAAFLSVNGLDPAELRRNKISIALTIVDAVTVTWKTSHARSGHLELRLAEPIFGSKPAPGWLKQVPFTSGVGFNSAWPELGPNLAGTYLVMAWRNGHPCGDGSAVHLGERFSLPMVVSGSVDPRVAAVRGAFKLISLSNAGTRAKKLRQAFREGTNPYLVLFADAGLAVLVPQHRTSAERYARLFALINGTPGSDEELGWPLVQELTRFPPLRDADAYQSWSRDSPGPAPDKTWPSFLQFRRLLQSRFRQVAADTKVSADLRRWALTALAAPPSFVGTRRDQLDAKAIAVLNERLRDPVVEVRRDAVRGLLTMAAALKSSDEVGCRRLLGQVRRALRTERDPDERANLQLRLGELAGEGKP